MVLHNMVHEHVVNNASLSKREFGEHTALSLSKHTDRFWQQDRSVRRALTYKKAYRHLLAKDHINAAEE